MERKDCEADEEQDAGRAPVDTIGKYWVLLEISRHWTAEPEDAVDEPGTEQPDWEESGVDIRHEVPREAESRAAERDSVLEQDQRAELPRQGAVIEAAGVDSDFVNN